MKKIFLILLLFGNVSFVLSQNRLAYKPYAFDTGSLDSRFFPSVEKINEKDVYDKKQGFGWITKPSGLFVRSDLETSGFRNNFTIDGITGKELEFKIDLPEGDWWFTFWMESGREVVNTAKLFVNDTEREISWHRIKPGAEDANNLMDIYRVYHTLIKVNKQGVDFRLQGVQDSIRLLGFTFIPKVEPADSIQKSYMKIIKEAGKYKSKVSLRNLANTLKTRLKKNQEDPFLFYWYQQISLIDEAERFWEMLGWEWERFQTGLSIFQRMHQAILLLDTFLENFDFTDYPLKERAQWMRGKICYDLELERGGKHELEISKQDLSRLFEVYPDDPSLAMLNGTKIDIPNACGNLPSSEGAPEWSNLQREVICRLSSEIEWWVNEKQAPNGELGGKIGDDVEILRWWNAFIFKGDEPAIKGWEKIADAVWNDPKVYKGYSKKPIDVEHASEFISDSTPELIMVDNDSTYLKRLEYTAKYFENLWTEKNRFGRRFFKSAWFSSTEVDERPPRNRDLEYNARAVKPLRYLAWATRNEKYIQLLSEWSKSWLHAALRTDKGKPKGIIPASMRWYDDALNGDEPNWYEANMLWNYFEWEIHPGIMMLDQFLFTYTLTKDDSLLLPIELTMDLVYDNIKADPDFYKKDYPKGSPEWAAKILYINENFWSVVGTWRNITCNNKYDEIIKLAGTDYFKYRLTQDESYITAGLRNILNIIRYNTPLRTTLVVHTDRVRTPGANHLKAMLTGDGTREGSSPYYTITWEDTDNDFTAFVKDHGMENLNVDIYSHSENDYGITLRLWQLDKGEYNFIIKDADGNIFKESQIEYLKSGQRFKLNLPAKKLIELVIKK
ncbi:MAG: hypothetical protein PVH88_16015 [Ignavibacteria bacterium]|jgi:hypothetical protein